MRGYLGMALVALADIAEAVLLSALVVYLWWLMTLWGWST